MKMSEQTIKERAEEMMNKMSEQLEIPYSPTLISTFEGLLLEYKEDTFSIIDEKIREFKIWIEENPQKDILYLVAEGCIKVLEETKSKIGENK